MLTNNEAELRVIGAILLKPSDLVEKVGIELSTDDFSHGKNRRIYSAILSLFSDGSPINLGTVDDATDKKCSEVLFSDLGGSLAIHSIDFWIKKVKESSNRRKISLLAESIVKECLDPTVPLDVIERNVAYMSDGASHRDNLQLLDLSNRPPVSTDWVIAGVLAAQTCVVCGAEDKAGKSWLLFDIALSVVTGKKLLNKWETKRTGKVLIYSPEGGWNSRSQRLWGMCWALGLDPKVVLKDVIFVSGPLDLSQESHITWLRRKIRDIQPVLLILDPLVCVALGIDENATKDLQPILREIRDLNEECNGMVIIVAHHMSKGGAERNMSKSLRGSSAIPAWLDTQINIYVEGDSSVPGTPRKITFRHRDGMSPAPYGFMLHIETSLQHMALPTGQVACSLVPWDPPQKDSSGSGNSNGSTSKLDSEIVLNIISALTACKDGLSKYAIAKQFNTNHQKIGRYLKYLQEKETVFFDGKNWVLK